jgi:hypothetical protein
MEAVMTGKCYEIYPFDVTEVSMAIIQFTSSN